MVQVDGALTCTDAHVVHTRVRATSYGWVGRFGCGWHPAPFRVGPFARAGARFFLSRPAVVLVRFVTGAPRVWWAGGWGGSPRGVWRVP